ncbi:hypothetical protein EYV94_10960 [Puteibacter caeruleilacunae]|nr:hypothetical protein EYV94_10960 [Puteibacter caeruleilacunae]
MRKLLLIILVSILVQSCNEKFDGIKIAGKAINADQGYVLLAHQPLYRGNLNFDDFKSVADKIDDKGNFSLSSEKAIDGACYWLQVKDRSFRLILFNGDDITLEFDVNDMKNTLTAKGKGAGKINVLCLPQFDTKLRFNADYTLDSYKAKVDSTIHAQEALLEVIYQQDLKSDLLQSAENKQSITNIINETPLSDKEYQFLKKKIAIQDIYYLGDFISYFSRQDLADKSFVDFSRSYFECFNHDRYAMIDNINCWQFEDCVGKILKMEYLKSIQKDSAQLTYNNFRIKDYAGYRKWQFDHAKDFLSQEVYDAYYGSLLVNGLTMGKLHKELHESYKAGCVNEKYLSRIDGFNELLNNGVSDEAFGLDTDENELNAQKLDALLKDNSGSNVYVTVWSAQFAGAFLISQLPANIDFAKEHQDEMKFLNICVDRQKNKGLWAARIIDNNWKGNHYFIPVENNDSLLHRFAAEHISSFCDGGVTYSFIDKMGDITNGVEAPILMSEEKMNGYFE